MAISQYVLSKNQRLGLLYLAEFSTPSYEGLQTKIREIDQTSIVATKLQDVLEEFASKERAILIFRTIAGMATASRYLRLTPDEFTALAEESIQKNDNDSDAIRMGLQRTRELLTINYVSISTKALDLSFDHQNLYRNSRVLVDIRPVFDDERDNLVGGIVSLLLRLDYTSGAVNHTLSMAMDRGDIIQLKDACEVALRKADRAHGFLTDSCNLNSFVIGEELEKND
ncbi:MAG: hypothetical protein RLO51_28965 [Thalassobaculum sp.]|uniref:hypothetical protein n=1 Tax=Thalassobaculum sp. TaxID=2022740 RepID=UPI0032F03F38